MIMKTTEIKQYNRIIVKIENALRKGSSSFKEYNNFVLSDVIENNQYHLYSAALLNKWNIDSKNYPTVESLIRSSYDIISKLLPTDEQLRLKELYDSYNIYQMGNEFYNNENGELLGVIKEVDVIEYSDMYNDKGFLDKMQIRHRVLYAYKGSEVVEYSDQNMDIYDKYDSAIFYLLS